MTVTLIVDQEIIELDNVTFRTSKAIVGALADTGKTDVEIKVLPEYWPVIGIYLNFIGGVSYDDKDQLVYPDNLPVIDDAKTLSVCFYMESFFDDQVFFGYLMKQAYAMWSKFLPLIDGCPHDRQIYLYSPYEFVPVQYRESPIFFEEWLTINANKEIVLEGDVTYYNQVWYHKNKQVEKVRCYHGSPGKKEVINHTPWPCMGPSADAFRQTGYEISMTWRENGQLWCRAIYKDGEQDGLTEAWYDNGQIMEMETFKGNRRHGPTQTWYQDGKLKSIVEYDMGQFVSIQKF